MALEDWIELNDAHVRILGFGVSLQDVKKQWLRAKKVFVDRHSHFSEGDFKVLLSIFEKGFEVVGEFYKKWKNKVLSLTDEELALLEEAFDEGSWVFSRLSNDFPHLLSSQDNQIKQQLIQKNKQIIVAEKQRRKNPDPPDQPKQINNSNNLFTKENVFFFFFLILTISVITVAYKISKKKRVRR